MVYYITVVNGNNRRIISKHENLAEALEKGKSVFKTTGKDELVDCISGEIDENGKIIGKYRLIQTWFK